MSQQAAFIYVKVPESIGPMVRGERYEDPIEEMLETLGLGEVTGGGTQLGDARADGKRPIESCGLDVEVTDLQRGLSALREELQRLGAPVGTELHYTVDKQSLQDELGPDGWRQNQLRTLRHPAFDT